MIFGNVRILLASFYGLVLVSLVHIGAPAMPYVRSFTQSDLSPPVLVIALAAVFALNVVVCGAYYFSARINLRRAFFASMAFALGLLAFLFILLTGFNVAFNGTEAVWPLDLNAILKNVVIAAAIAPALLRLPGIFIPVKAVSFDTRRLGWRVTDHVGSLLDENMDAAGRRTAIDALRRDIPTLVGSLEEALGKRLSVSDTALIETLLQTLNDARSAISRIPPNLAPDASPEAATLKTLSQKLLELARKWTVK